MKRQPVTEAALAAEVVSFLEGMGADVYQEVPVAGGIADIVAKFGRMLWIVETKTSWSMDLLLQCVDRQRSAHCVFAAGPACDSAGPMLAKALGIGAIEVRVPDGRWGGDAGYVRVLHRPQLLTSRPLKLEGELVPQYKTAAPAGTSGGGRWTEFRSTCDALERAVATQPGRKMSEVVKDIKHHYCNDRSARSVLVRWVEGGHLKIEIRQEGKDRRLYPLAAPPGRLVR